MSVIEGVDDDPVIRKLATHLFRATNLPKMPTNQPVNELIAECRRRGITLSATATGVKCSGPRGRLTVELKASLTVNGDRVRLQLLAEGGLITSGDAVFSAKDGLQPRRAPSIDWPQGLAAVVDFVLLLDPNDLPTTPFILWPGRTILDAEKFLRSLQADIRRGPAGPRGKLGSLQSDIQLLSNVVLERAASWDAEPHNSGLTSDFGTRA